MLNIQYLDHEALLVGLGDFSKCLILPRLEEDPQWVYDLVYPLFPKVETLEEDYILAISVSTPMQQPNVKGIQCYPLAELHFEPKVKNEQKVMDLTLHMRNSENKIVHTETDDFTINEVNYDDVKKELTDRLVNIYQWCITSTTIANK